MNIAVCVNPNCTENGLPKDASALDPMPALIQCGGCGRPCEIREQA